MIPARLLLTLATGFTLAEEMPPPANAETAPTTVSPASTPTTQPAPTDTTTTVNPFSGRVVLGAGYDSNALLLDETNEFVTSLDGATFSGSLLLRYRFLRTNDHRLEIGATADYDHYVDQDEATQFRVGIAGTWAKRVGQWLPGANLGGYRYTIDGEAAATVLTGSFAWNRPTPTWAALPSLDVLWIDYDDLDAADGVLLALNYRHWFILRPGKPASRIEASLKIGTYQAEEDYETYVMARPGIEWRWQDDRGGELSQWTFVGRAWYEYRSYDEPVPLAGEEETAHRFSIGGEADRRLTPWLTGGGYIAATTRRANIAAREYDRFQVGLRLGASF